MKIIRLFIFLNLILLIIQVLNLLTATVRAYSDITKVDIVSINGRAIYGRVIPVEIK